MGRRLKSSSASCFQIFQLPILILILYHVSIAKANTGKPKSIFTSVSPKLIRPYSKYEVFVAVEKTGLPTSFLIQIKGSPLPIIPEQNPPEIVPLAIADDDGAGDDEEGPEPRVGAKIKTKPTTTKPPKIIQPVQTYKSKEIKIEPGQSKLILIPIHDLKYDEYNLTIKSITENEQKFEETTKIFKDTKVLTILIQTDKPIYKPSEYVKLRVVILNRELCPFQQQKPQQQPQGKRKGSTGAGAGVANGPAIEELEVIIKDPRRNVIKELKKQQIKNGFFSYKFQLSDEPNLGNWIIQATLKKAVNISKNAKEAGEGEGEEEEGEDTIDNSSGDEIYVDDDIDYDSSDKNIKTSSLQFTVDQYVLPKFKIDLKLNPTFITYNNSKVIIQIDALYTYGKPMVGYCQVILSEAYPTYDYGYYTTSIEYDSNGNRIENSQHEPKIKSISKQVSITKNGSVFIEFDIMKEFINKLLKNDPNYNNNNRYQKEFKFFTIVTDTLTSRTQNLTKMITMYEFPHRIELINTPSSYKPGFPLSLTIKVSKQDDTPISDPSPKALSIKHGFSFKAEDGIIFTAIPKNGLVKIQIPTPTNEFMSTTGMEVEYKGLIQHLYPPQKAYSNSKSYIQISLVNEHNSTVSLYSEIMINVKVNKPIDSLNYILFGHGEILVRDKIIFDAHTLEAEFSITELPTNVAPESILIVYCVLANTNNEVIGDSIKIKPIEGIKLKNHLSLKLSKGPTVEPGENISLHLATEPDSLVALRGIDQSVLLLSKDRDNDITLNKIEDEVRKFQSGYTSYRIWGGSGTFQIFEEGGLTIITNGELEKQQWYRPYYYGGFRPRRGRFGGAVGMALEMDEAAPEGRMFAKASASSPAPQAFSDSRSNSNGPEIRTRKNFLESWLWEEIYMTDPSGSKINTVVPDTLTSWIITGYSLHNEKGIGITDPYTVETFRPFFLTLNVPYSVVKGETIGLQVLVHNYLNQEIEAEITLNNINDSIEYNEKVNKNRSKLTKSIKIGSNSVTSVIFVITPIRFGIIKLNVLGKSNLVGDQLEQPLIVKPPGHKVIDNTAVLVTLKTNSTDTEPATKNNDKLDSHETMSLKADFPAKWVSGTEEIKVSVVGDILGSAIHNLDKLLRLPTGCGEQNMLNFVPDVLVLDYLKTSGGLTKRIEAKAIKFLEIGYQRELTYRHSDGSFSAFGKSDPYGSTWLTAFVIRSFITAKHYITIDANVIRAGLQFLIQKQHKDGSFIEFGAVLHHDLKGGAKDNSLALSAYVLLALLEAQAQNITTSVTIAPLTTRYPRNNNNNLNKDGEVVPDAEEIKEQKISVAKAIQKGLKYLVDSYELAANDSYCISLITYALTIANDKAKEQYFKDLDSLKIKDDYDWFHWENPKVNPEDGSGWDGNEVLYHWRISPATVEMTSYALLSYIERNDLKNALQIVNWLIDQRNENGGFYSTQDTIVGLTALTKFAALTHSVKPDLQVKVIYYYKISNDDFEKAENIFTVNQQNSISLQELYLPSNLTKKQITVEVSGKGSVLVYLTWSYYIEDPIGLTKPPFSVDIKITPNPVHPSEIKLNICSHLLTKTKSNMIIQEITLPSGYIFSEEDIQEVIGSIKKQQLIKRFDLQDAGTKLEIYYDYFLKNATNCLDLPANRIFKVSNPAKAYVQITDYYDTTMKRVVYYQPPAYSTCDICKQQLNEVQPEGEEEEGSNTNGIDAECEIQNC